MVGYKYHIALLKTLEKEARKKLQSCSKKNRGYWKGTVDAYHIASRLAL